MSKKRYDPPAFHSNPELFATRDEILYLGLKAPFRLKELASQLSKQSYDIIYQHAIVGRQFAYIARDAFYSDATMVRRWQKAVLEYHKKFKEVAKE